MAARLIAYVDAAAAAGDSSVPTMRLRWAPTDLGSTDPLLWGWNAEDGIWTGPGCAVERGRA